MKRCVHHWLLDPPDGPTVWGICKKCGAKREFPATYRWEGWQDDGAAKMPPLTLERVRGFHVEPL